MFEMKYNFEKKNIFILKIFNKNNTIFSPIREKHLMKNLIRFFLQEIRSFSLLKLSEKLLTWLLRIIFFKR